MIISYVVSLFDVILDNSCVFGQRFLEPVCQARAQRPTQAESSSPQATASVSVTATCSRSDPVHVQHTAWYRNTESDSSCSVAKFDSSYCPGPEVHLLTLSPPRRKVSRDLSSSSCRVRWALVAFCILNSDFLSACSSGLGRILWPLFLL